MASQKFEDRAPEIPGSALIESSVEFRAPALSDEDLAIRFTERHAHALDAKPASSDEAPEAPHDCSCITVNDFHAFMPSHGYIFAPTGAMWPAISVNALITPIVDNGKAVPASTWLDRHRHVEQMTWAPGEPTVIRDRLIAGGGWTQHQGARCFNLYQGPDIAHGDAALAWPRTEGLPRGG
jgi:hypothetical protein